MTWWHDAMMISLEMLAHLKNNNCQLMRVESVISVTDSLILTKQHLFDSDTRKACFLTSFQKSKILFLQIENNWDKVCKHGIGTVLTAVPRIWFTRQNSPPKVLRFGSHVPSNTDDPESQLTKITHPHNTNAASSPWFQELTWAFDKNLIWRSAKLIVNSDRRAIYWLIPLPTL